MGSHSTSLSTRTTATSIWEVSTPGTVGLILVDSTALGSKYSGLLPRLERLNRYIIPNSYPRLVEHISRRQAPGEDMGRSLSPRVRGNRFTP